MKLKMVAALAFGAALCALPVSAQDRMADAMRANVLFDVPLALGQSIADGIARRPLPAKRNLDEHVEIFLTFSCPHCRNWWAGASRTPEFVDWMKGPDAPVLRLAPSSKNEAVQIILWESVREKDPSAAMDLLSLIYAMKTDRLSVGEQMKRIDSWLSGRGFDTIEKLQKKPDTLQGCGEKIEETISRANEINIQGVPAFVVDGAETDDLTILIGKRVGKTPDELKERWRRIP